MSTVPAAAHSWGAFLLGGPSGVGKSSVSYPLAHRWQVALTEVDDLVIALEELTTPAQQPEIHFWQTHPDAVKELSAEDILIHQINLAQALVPAVHAVIANHVDTALPVILDGDYLLPEVCAASAAATHGDQVRGVFLYEPDEEQIVANFLQREPAAGRQQKRARQLVVRSMATRAVQPTRTDSCLRAAVGLAHRTH